MKVYQIRDGVFALGNNENDGRSFARVVRLGKRDKRTGRFPAGRPTYRRVAPGKIPAGAHAIDASNDLWRALRVDNLIAKQRAAVADASAAANNQET